MANSEISNATVIEATAGVVPALIGAGLDSFEVFEAPCAIIGLVVSTAIIFDALRRVAHEACPPVENDPLNT